MPNPYDITQVDIPGVYGAVQTAHMNRIQQMLGERQVQAADRQADRENQITQARLALFGQLSGNRGASSGAAGAATPAAPSPSPVDAVSASYGLAPTATPAITPVGLPGANPAGTPSLAGAAPPATPAPTAGPMRIDPNSPEARNLIMADPEHGEALIHGINAASDEQIAQAQQRLTRLAPLYIQAAHIPYGTDGSARRAFIQSVLPQLQQLGIDPQQAMSWDPTDQNLNAHISLGQTVSDATASVAPHPMVAPLGSHIIDTANVDPATGRPHVVYEDPNVPGPGGMTYARPPSMSTNAATPPQPGEVRQTSRGRMRFNGGDYRNPANYSPVGAGGAPPPNAAGTFRQDGGAFDFRANPTPGG